MLANTRQSYGLISQVFHWVIAVLILIILMLGIYMYDLPIITLSEINYKIWLYSLHKTLGILAFFTAILLVCWTFIQKKPLPINGKQKFESLLANTVHWSLYGSIILMPITGWLHHATLEGFAPIWWPFSQDLPFITKNPSLAEVLSTSHKFTAIILIFSIVLHILGAMKHLFIDKDQTLNRMLPWRDVNFSSDLSEVKNKSSARFLAGSIFATLIVAVYATQFNFEQSSEIVNSTPSPTSSRWVIDHENSSLNIEIVQNKDSIKGRFATWNADIVFNPQKLHAASVKVIVDTKSLLAGGIATHALSYNFLNVAEFPQAIFTSENFIQTTNGKYQAQGELSLAGTTKVLTLPFDLRIENERAFMESTIEIQRLDYGLGSTGYKTDEFLGYGVKISIMLQASKT